MPTGYTADLYEGKDVSFNEFVMKCARGMGALIEMRDESMDAPIPPAFSVADYYSDRVSKAEAALAEAYERTCDDWAQLEEQSRRDDNQKREQALAETAARRGRYEAMLTQVEAWVPPTREHVKFREFMIEQLTSSIKFDGDSGDWWKPVSERSWDEFRRDQLVRLHAQKNRAIEALHEEEHRVAGRNEWVRALRESLAGGASA